MAQFITRIELHNAQLNEYDTLHEAMRKAGFTRTITADGGATYHLPWAEYNIVGNFSCNTVIEAAKRAAATTGRSFAVLVTEATRIQWDGLTLVR